TWPNCGSWQTASGTPPGRHASSTRRRCGWWWSGSRPTTTYPTKPSPEPPGSTGKQAGKHPLYPPLPNRGGEKGVQRRSLAIRPVVSPPTRHGGGHDDPPGWAGGRGSGTDSTSSAPLRRGWSYCRSTPPPRGRNGALRRGGSQGWEGD